MALISTLLDRIADMTQDRDNTAWSRDEKRRILLHETTLMARFQLFGQIEWQQGVAGTGRYSVGDDTIDLAEVIYDGQVLHRTTEEQLDRKGANWEGTTGHPPQYVVTDHQAVNQFRLVPQPQDTGDGTPLIPPAPLLGVPEKNLVVWRFIDPQTATGEAQESGLPTMVEDVAVFRAVATLCTEETDFKELTKAAFFRQLADLYLQQLGITA